MNSIQNYIPYIVVFMQCHLINPFSAVDLNKVLGGCGINIHHGIELMALNTNKRAHSDDNLRNQNFGCQNIYLTMTDLNWDFQLDIGIVYGDP